MSIDRDVTSVFSGELPASPARKAWMDAFFKRCSLDETLCARYELLIEAGFEQMSNQLSEWGLTCYDFFISLWRTSSPDLPVPSKPEVDAALHTALNVIAIGIAFTQLADEDAQPFTNDHEPDEKGN